MHIIKHIPRWLITGLLISLGLGCLVILWNIAYVTNLGGEDFVVYWSATYLFHNGLNPYNPALMRGVLQTLIPIAPDYTPMAWNPPFLFIFLLAFAWLPYTTAKFIWLITNIVTVLVATLMLARMYFPAGKHNLVLIYVLFAFSLPQVVVGIFIGQVTFLVLLGVVACMLLIKKGQWFWAGTVLILTTIKPHMVILVLIYLLLIMARRRKYQGWAGLALAGLICVAGLFVFRLEWVKDLIGEMSIAPVHWGTPTIGGLLSYYGVSEAARYMILLFLPLPIILARYEAIVKLELAVALLTLITVPTTFFGWSFDQTIMLIPIALVFSWMIRSKNKAVKAGFFIAIGIALVVNWSLRIFNSDDVFFVWYPLFWWIIFGVFWYLSTTKIAAQD